MEEKDVTFNFVITEPDENDNFGINITSDIDDCIDYLNVQEKLCLVTEILGQCCRQIISENHPSEMVEDFDEEDEDQIDTKHKLDQLLEETVYVAINTINSTYRAKFNKTPEVLEFSLATYNSTINKYFQEMHRVKETYHSVDVDVLDPLQASFDFFTDTILCLLDGGMPKEQVMTLIEDSTNAMRKDYKILIDDFEKE